MFYLQDKISHGYPRIEEVAGEGEEEEEEITAFAFLVPFPNLVHATVLINNSVTHSGVQTKEYKEDIFQARRYLGKMK